MFTILQIAVMLLIGPMLSYALEISGYGAVVKKQSRAQLLSRAYALWCDFIAVLVVLHYGQDAMWYVVPVLLAGQAVVWTTIRNSLLHLQSAAQYTAHTPIRNAAISQTVIGLAMLSFLIALGSNHIWSGARLYIPVVLIGGIALSSLSIHFATRNQSHFASLALLSANLLSVFTLYVCEAAAHNVPAMIVSGASALMTIVWATALNTTFAASVSLNA